MHKISLATQSLWDRSFEEAAETAARVGYDALEIVCHDPFLPLPELWKRRKSAPRRLRDLGLEVASLTIITHFTNPDTISHNTGFLNAIVDLAEPYGTDLVKMSPGPPLSADASPEQWSLAVRRITDCADYAREKGVTLAIETHLNQLSDHGPSTLRLVREVDRPNVGVVLDWCNIMVMGGDPLAATELLGPYVRLVHAKDGHMTPETPRWDPIGEGDLDYPALLDALAATGYDGVISVECLLKDDRYDFTNQPTDPEEIVSRDLATLRRLAGQGAQ